MALTAPGSMPTRGSPGRGRTHFRRGVRPLAASPPRPPKPVQPQAGHRDDHGAQDDPHPWWQAPRVRQVDRRRRRREMVHCYSSGCFVGRVVPGPVYPRSTSCRWSALRRGMPRPPVRHAARECGSSPVDHPLRPDSESLPHETRSPHGASRAGGEAGEVLGLEIRLRSASGRRARMPGRDRLRVTSPRCARIARHFRSAQRVTSTLVVTYESGTARMDLPAPSRSGPSGPTPDSGCVAAYRAVGCRGGPASGYRWARPAASTASRVTWCVRTWSGWPVSRPRASCPTTMSGRKPRMWVTSG